MEGAHRPFFSFSNFDQLAQLEGPPRSILEIGGRLEPTIVLSIVELFLGIIIWLGSHRLSRDDPSRVFVSTFSFQIGLSSIAKGSAAFIALNGNESGVFSILFTLLTLLHRSSLLLFPLCSSLLILSLALISKKREDCCSCSPIYHLFSLLVFLLLVLCFLLSDLLSSIPILIFHSINATVPILLVIVIIICLPIGGCRTDVSIDSRDKAIVNARTRFLWTCIYVIPPVLLCSLSYVSSMSFVLKFIHEIPQSTIPHAVTAAISQLSMAESSWSFHLFNILFLFSTIFLLPSYRIAISCRSLQITPKTKEESKTDAPPIFYSNPPCYINYGDRALYYSV